MRSSFRATLASSAIACVVASCGRAREPPPAAPAAATTASASEPNAGADGRDAAAGLKAAVTVDDAQLARLLREANANGAVLVTDVATGAVVASAGRGRDVGAPVLPLSTIKLYLAALWWEHDRGDGLVRRSDLRPEPPALRDRRLHRASRPWRRRRRGRRGRRHPPPRRSAVAVHQYLARNAWMLGVAARRRARQESMRSMPMASI